MFENFDSWLDRALARVVLRPPYRALLTKRLPTLWIMGFHRLALKKLENYTGKHELLFQQFLEETKGKPCLQIGIKNVFGGKFGPNWVATDLYDKRKIVDYNYDVHDMGFQDNEFDGIVCWSVLEHVPYPQKAIEEMRRVLKPGGLIWIQLPFNFPYHEAPKDYWRVTPDGLRVWMEAFEEVHCGVDAWAGTSLITATFFWGRKPLTPSASPS